MKNKVIFFGNGMLAEFALAVLERECQILFHAHSREDLEEACRLKRENPETIGVLASFGVLIPGSVLRAFEPEGILNIHPSLLPLYRGASPIESAILDGEVDFSVSVMKLAAAMDAGPIYMQATLSGLPLDKEVIYRELATVGAKMVVSLMRRKGGVLARGPEPQNDEKATFCGKLSKDMAFLQPETENAEAILRKIIAFAGWPKAKYAFFGVSCIVLEAHILKQGERAVLELPCADGSVLAIDRLQPEGRKAMDAKSFVNGYGK